jgi:hypothetical protein
LHAAIALAEKLEKSVRLNAEVLSDLTALLGLERWSGMSAWRTEEHVRIRIETDAIRTHYGGAVFLDGEDTARQFDGDYEDDDIAVQEARAALDTVTQPSLAEKLNNVAIDLYVDNENVRWSLQRYRSRSVGVRQVLKQLLEWQLAHNVSIKVDRVSTENNALADGRSRIRQRTAAAAARKDGPFELRLQASAWNRVQSWARGWANSTCTIDACANAASTKLPRFVRDPEDVGPDTTAEPSGIPGGGALSESEAVAMDVLAYTFPNRGGLRELIYAFPPKQLVGAVWRHFELIGARGLMVAVADPSAQWWTRVMTTNKSYGAIAVAGDRDALSVYHAGKEQVYRLKEDLCAFYFDFE